MSYPKSPYIKGKNFNPFFVAKSGIPKYADSLLNPKVVGTPAWEEYWQEIVYYCANGYRTGGLDIPGRYFYYGNFNSMSTNTGVISPDMVDLHLELAYILDHCIKNKKNLILAKKRRGGISEFFQKAKVDYDYRFNPGSQSGVASGLDTFAQEFMKKWRFGDALMPPELRLKMLKDNDKEIIAGYKFKNENRELVNGGSKSTIYVRTMNRDAALFKGLALSTIIGEECGEFEKLEDFYNDSKACLMQGSVQTGVFIFFGCVCAGTKVWDNDGNLINIEDLRVKDGIIGYDGIGYYKGKINGINPPRKKPCYRIETSGGNFLECSNDHPIMMSNIKLKTNRSGRSTRRVMFKKAEEIKIGDVLAMISEVPIFGEQRVSYARILGLLIGDGNYTEGATPQLSLADDEIREYVKSNTLHAIYKSYTLQNGKLFESVGLKGYQKTLRKHGIYGQVKDNKRLPSDIDTFDEYSIRELIAGYYDADGNVTVMKNKNHIKVVLSSTDYELLQQMKYLLIKLGIGSYICKENRGKNSEKISKNQKEYIFRLYVSRTEDVKTFASKIKLLCKHKQDILDKAEFLVKYKNTRDKNIRNDYLINENYPEKGEYFNGKINMTNMKFSRVTKVEYIGEKDVYNLNVSETHTYIANGFITSNTGGNINKGSADFQKIWNNAEDYNFEKFLITAKRFHFPYYGGATPIDGIVADTPNLLKTFQPYQIIGVEDLEAAEKNILDNRAEALKSKNMKKYREELKNYPLTEADIFTSTVDNDFDIDILNDQQVQIDSNPKKYIACQLDYKKDPKTKEVKYPFELEVRVDNMVDEKGVCFLIHEDFLQQFKGWDSLFVGGVDSYDQDKAKSSKSLGAMCVTVRRNTIGGMMQMAPVATICCRPQRREIFYEMCFKLSIWFNLRGNTLIDVANKAIFDYYIQRGGEAYLAYRPKKFEGDKSEQTHTYGFHLNLHSKPLMVGFMQSMILDYGNHIWFPELIKQLRNYNVAMIGSDNDLADAYGISLVQDVSSEMKPRDTGALFRENPFALPEWVDDGQGNMIRKERGNENAVKQLFSVERDHPRFGQK